jgi:hypothetical protein
MKFLIGIYLALLAGVAFSGSNVQRLTVTGDGNTRANLRDGSSKTIVASGLYTPTYTNVANHPSGFGPYEVAYTVIGKVLTIGGRVDVLADLPNTLTIVDVTIPPGYAIKTGIGKCGGAGVQDSPSGTRQDAATIQNVTSTEFQMAWDAASDTSRAFTFTVTCQLQ